jgi:hypothetical protein
MRALALTAVLLLALMPSAARLLASPAAASGARAGGWVELCTMAGLKLVKLDPATPAAPDTGKHAHDGDCDYCPLLHSLTPTAALTPMVLASQPALPPPALRAPQRLPATPLVGLGSRGPPLA